jgi:hypothetical protein
MVPLRRQGIIHGAYGHADERAVVGYMIRTLRFFARAPAGRAFKARSPQMKRKRRIKTLQERNPPTEPCGCDVCRGYCKRPGWWTVEEGAPAATPICTPE